MLIGAHTSAQGGVSNALLEGSEIGATTIQLFTANQRRWVSKPLAEEEIVRWKKTLKETGLKKIMSHDSYLINLGAPDPEILAKSREAFVQEIQRCQALEIDFLNFHPGSALDKGEEACIKTIVESLLSFKNLLAQGKTRVILEMTAGQGSSVGYKFEQIEAILKEVHKEIPIGVCIDTCHIFAAGYDIRTKDGWERTLEDFDRIIGLKHLYAFHMNDSMKGLGSRVDRHADIGTGMIGLESFKVLVTHPLLKDMPKYLETPSGKEVWKKEIALLKSFAE